MKKTEMPETKEYAQLFEQIKTDILQSQIRAAQAVTQELTQLYWRIGKLLSEKIAAEEWGSKVVERLAEDLNSVFPGMAGFSRTNVYRMLAFYEAYPNCPTAVGQLARNPIFMIPWGHSAVLLEKIANEEQRIWYAEKAIQNGCGSLQPGFAYPSTLSAVSNGLAHWPLTTDGYQTKHHYNFITESAWLS